MRPRSFDDVLLAYQMGLQALHTKEDHLRAAVEHVARLQEEIREQTNLVRAMREDVRTHGQEVAA